MAVRRSTNPKNSEFTFYTGTDTILADVIDDSNYSQNLEILPENRVKKLVIKGDEVDHAVVEDLMEGESYPIAAKAFVVASGAVMSAYILWNSGIARHVVGKYIIEHPIAFTQIVLRQEIIDKIKDTPDFEKRMEAQRQRTREAEKAIDPKAPIPGATNRCRLTCCPSRWMTRPRTSGFRSRRIAPGTARSTRTRSPTAHCRLASTTA